MKAVTTKSTITIPPPNSSGASAIRVHAKTVWFAEMESTLLEMLREGKCEPDVWTMNSTLRAFGSSGQIETMEKCYEKFQSAGIEPNIKTFNILLDSYGKAEKYEKMSAMEYLFRLMRSERIKPSCVTLCSLVRAYGRAGKAEKIGGVLRFIENSDVMLDIVFFNCLVDAYGRLGCFAEMKGVLEMMKKKGCKPDKITYRTMIKAYKIGGMTSCAKELQGLMRMPDETRLEMGKPDFR
ncbi:Pentatricopeptide repeat-containing protein, chloroplastic [Vitis vinifera]|uniref:Pentatricopeptide repeat-containing protein, chloroplastic n=1 Tax=Vitis vinifera TaxID=29760 RepID=A0A438IN04_VITVI|nr:Pentatricopeptide repeat-containing protein, chloroplastic [Vitis vinifera]